MPDVPKWTVFYNITGSRWIGKGWEFFDDRDDAKVRYDALAADGHVPTLRPWHPNDIDDMGATHRDLKLEVPKV